MPLYDQGTLRTVFIAFENDDWEDELAAFYHTDVARSSDSYVYESVLVSYNEPDNVTCVRCRWSTPGVRLNRKYFHYLWRRLDNGTLAAPPLRPRRHRRRRYRRHPPARPPASVHLPFTCSCLSCVRYRRPSERRYLRHVS